MPPTVLFAAAGAFVLQFFVWFRTGQFLASGDISPLLNDGLRSELGWLWTHQNSGAGGPTTEVARAADVLFAMIGRGLGGTEALGQRLMFATIWAFAAAGVAALASRFTNRTSVVTGAGLIAVCNPFVLIVEPNPLPMIAIGVCGVTAALAVSAARGESRHWLAFAAALVPCSYLALNPPLLLMIAVWIALLPVLAPLLGGTGWSGVTRTFGLLWRAALIAVPAALWWAVPSVLAIAKARSAGTIGAQTDVAAWAWTHDRNSLANVVTLFAHWSWPRPEFYGDVVSLQEPWWYWTRWLLPAGVVLAPFLGHRDRRRGAAVVLGLVGVLVVLGKGLHPPFSGLNRWLYDHVPGLWLLREPSTKTGVWMVVLYTFGWVVTVDGLLSRLSARATRLYADRVDTRDGVTWYRRRAVALGLVAAIPIIAAWPIWTGLAVRGSDGAVPGDRVALPAAWRDTASVVNESPVTGKALVLPVNDYYQLPTTWGFYGADGLVRQLLHRPVIYSNPELYIGDDPTFSDLVESTEQAIAYGDAATVAPLLRALGVSHIVVRTDLVYDSPIRAIDMERPEPLIEGLGDVPGVDLLAVSDVAHVFEFDDPAVAPVTLLGGTLDIGSTDDASLGSLLASIPEGVALSDIDNSLIKGQAWAGDVSAVPQAFATAAPGTWSAQRRSVDAPAYHLVVARTDRGAELVLRDATRWNVGGRELSTRPDIVLAAVPGDVVGVVLDGELRAASGEPLLVRLDAATELSPVVLEGGSPGLGPRSELLDCHRHDDTPRSELGFALHEEIVDGRPVIEVRARRHAACVRADVADVGPGAQYWIDVTSKQVAGAAPATCLWLEGLDRCAPLPAAVAGADGWAHVRMLWTVPDGVTGASLFLYAYEDHEGGETVSWYRAPLVQRASVLEPVAVEPVAAPESKIDLDAGRTEVDGELDVAQPVIDPFGRVADCHRYDSMSEQEAGLASEVIPGGIRLQARHHSACVNARVQGLVSEASYELSFEFRHVSGERPRVCLFDRLHDRCLHLPPVEPDGDDWTAYRTVFRAPAVLAGTEPALFVYADGDGSGTVNEYRNLSIDPVVSERITLVSQIEEMTAVPDYTWDEVSPARYRISVDDVSHPFVLSLSDAWSKDWVVRGLPEGASVEQIRIDGYRNGWVIDASGDLELTVEYGPARYGRYGLFASAAMAVVALVTALVAPIVRLRTERAGWRYIAPRGVSSTRTLALDLTSVSEGSES